MIGITGWSSTFENEGSKGDYAGKESMNTYGLATRLLAQFKVGEVNDPVVSRELIVCGSASQKWFSLTGGSSSHFDWVIPESGTRTCLSGARPPKWVLNS